MLKKTITYTDYDGVELTEDFYFNLSKAELTEMELTTVGGFKGTIEKIVAAHDTPALVVAFKDLILKAYGVKSADNKRFMKTDENGRKLCDMFKETEAYSVLFMELATDDKKAAEFINGVIPADLAKAVKEEANKKKTAAKE